MVGAILITWILAVLIYSIVITIKLDRKNPIQYLKERVNMEFNLQLKDGIDIEQFAINRFEEIKAIRSYKRTPEQKLILKALKAKRLPIQLITNFINSQHGHDLSFSDICRPLNFYIDGLGEHDKLSMVDEHHLWAVNMLANSIHDYIHPISLKASIDHKTLPDIWKFQQQCVPNFEPMLHQRYNMNKLGQAVFTASTSNVSTVFQSQQKLKPRLGNQPFEYY